MTGTQERAVLSALDRFRIEIPSWGFANTGTRFGKFIQAAAATTTEEKFSDAGQVHPLTGGCPTIAMHVLWDFPNGVDDVRACKRLRQDSTASAAAPSTPIVFQDQMYKHGSLGNPDASSSPTPRLQHILDSIEIQQACGAATSRCGSPTASSYPGTANIRAAQAVVRRRACKSVHSRT